MHRKYWKVKLAPFFVLILAAALWACQPTAPTDESAAEGEAAAETAPGQARSYGSGGSGSTAGAVAPRVTPPPPPVARTVTVDAGTAFRVRTTNTLSTKTTKPGEQFAASLEEPITSGNSVVAGKGASVRGTIVESDPGGRVKGLARLAVRVTEIETTDGWKQVNTGAYAVEAEKSTKKDLTKVAIGTGIGAAIGAIAGGGKGAAVGAGAGAGAGTGAVLATRGDAAEIHSESILAFSLNDPLTVEVR
jgi:hypothetical protein